MRTLLLTTTALVAISSFGAIAQEAAPAAPGTNSTLLTQGYDIVDTDGLASRLMGFPVYNAASNEAEQIGEVNDLVIGQDGQVAAVIIGVGGFLGVGEKNVAVEYSQLQWVVAEDNTERLVLETTKEALETAMAVEMIDDNAADTAAVTPAPAADQPADAIAPATDTAATEAPADAIDEDLETGAIAPAAPGAEPMTTPFDPAGMSEFDESTLTAEELIGTNVYGPDNQHIGTIGDLVLGTEGNIDAVIIDFGGFLGIGVKEVAVGYDDLDFYADPNNNRSLLLNVTREQMDQAVAFNRDTYESERDAQRLTVSQL